MHEALKQAGVPGSSPVETTASHEETNGQTPATSNENDDPHPARLSRPAGE